ncbi:BnaCnng45540D [Brassica napus]|uniref:BnaCnng45540D protein n=1 Tax=Brassica napus TaxID=3708 RepID=A0A078JHP6_BRANA|nr:BnaCnng45540D [Brassica napus]
MTLVLSLDQIHSVELVGSGSRIPAISKMLSSLFKRELGRTVNASECRLFPKGQVFLSVKIGPFQISHGEAARVNVRVQLNLHGIVSIDSASLIEDHKENMTSEERNNHQSSATKDDTSSSTVTEQDLKMESTKDKKNALESFVYEMRDKMLNTYRNTATESERECIVRNLQETEEWLYEDGDDESENAYIEKLNDIRKLIDPIENRFKG